MNRQHRPNRSDLIPIVGEEVDELTDEQRLAALHWLTGYNPLAVRRAIDWTMLRELRA